MPIKIQKKTQNKLDKVVGAIPVIGQVWGGLKAADQVAETVARGLGLTTRRVLLEKQQAEWDRRQREIAESNLVNRIADNVAARSRPSSFNNYTSVNIYSNPVNAAISIPVPPPSKLKPIGITPDYYPFKDEKQPVITVENDISTRKWGKLLHSPVSNNKLKINNYKIKDLEKEISKAQKTTIAKLDEWTDETDIEFPHKSIVFLDNVNIEKGEIEHSIVLGSESLFLIYGSFYLRSQNVDIPVIDSLFKEIEFKTNFIPPLVSSFDLNANVGVQNFEEIIVPESITKQDSTEVKLKSPAQAFGYLIKTIDELMGEFPIKIQIEDANATQAGNQKLELELPNLAEGIAEIFGLLVATNQSSQVNTALITDNLMVSTQGLISSNVTQDLALANADYLGYGLQQEERKLKLPFNPEGEQFSELIKPSEMSYESYDNKDDKNLQHDMVRLVEAASIIKASLFKKFGMNNLTEEVKKYLEGLKTENNENFDDPSWNKFLEEVERGFGNFQVKNPSEPYGESLNNRPLIRDLTNGNQKI
ncbi:MAG: hypothetical protein ACRC80_08520 [Waterburya sp.]